MTSPNRSNVGTGSICALDGMVVGFTCKHVVMDSRLKNKKEFIEDVWYCQNKNNMMRGKYSLASFNDLNQTMVLGQIRDIGLCPGNDFAVFTISPNFSFACNYIEGYGQHVKFDNCLSLANTYRREDGIVNVMMMLTR